MKTVIALLFFCLLSIANAVPLKMALVMSGNFNDLGYNFMLNTARINTEYELGIDITLLQNVDTPEAAVFVIEDLVLQGYNFIISGSFEHATAALNMSTKYPNVFFCDKGRRGLLSNPNLCRLAFDGIDRHFILGYYAGLLSVTGKVGFVVPATPAGFNYTSNAIYLGLKQTCPSCELYIVKTNTYKDPPRAVKGATDQLIDNNCDIIGQIQDDSVVTEYVMEREFLGIGNTGYPLSSLYGGKLGIGVTQDWTPMYLPLAESILNDTWVPSRVIIGSFGNGQTKLDRLSPHVPEVFRNLILAQANNTVKYYLCGPLVAEIPRSNASNNCVTESEFYAGAAPQFSGIIDFGIYEIPLVETKLPSGIKLAFIIISGIAIVLVGITIGLVFILRKAAAVISSSVLFTIIMCLGSLFIYISVILWVLTPTHSTCSSKIWVASLGYAIMIGSMLIKNIRIWLIFDNTSFKKRTIPNWKLSLGLMSLLIVHIILLAVWDHTANSQPVNLQGIDNIDEYSYITVCQTEVTGSYVLDAILLVHGLTLLFGCFLSYKLRDVSLEDFNESKTIAMILNSLALCLFIVIPLLVIDQTRFNIIVVMDAAMYFTTSTSLIIFFIPKVISLFSGIKNKKQFRTGPSKDSTELSATAHSRDTREVTELPD